MCGVLVLVGGVTERVVGIGTVVVEFFAAVARLHRRAQKIRYLLCFRREHRRLVDDGDALQISLGIKSLRPLAGELFFKLCYTHLADDKSRDFLRFLAIEHDERLGVLFGM